MAAILALLARQAMAQTVPGTASYREPTALTLRRVGAGRAGGAAPNPIAAVSAAAAGAEAAR